METPIGLDVSRRAYSTTTWSWLCRRGLVTAPPARHSAEADECCEQTTIVYVDYIA